MIPLGLRHSVLVLHCGHFGRRSRCFRAAVRPPLCRCRW
ncbi:hypothetical protein SGL43_05179 [Streptomyces globisporus]|uniref:Uncharacterized protein n=1 Tax=Streptomyces globisporus TaxID=1908 RepID=A0ABM9H3C6_STRGL|nr:hypothetical protein SGL43_05179 [Streptomyces globisporus]